MSFYKCGFFHAQWFQIRRNPDLLVMHNKILEIQEFWVSHFKKQQPKCQGFHYS